MLVMCSAYALTIGGIVFFQAVSGTGSTKTAFKLELTALIVYVLYCTVVIGIMKADIAVCWTAEHVYAAVLLIISYAYLKSGRWKNRQI
jgi:Na+-driven multidrug efflux pump